jgi:hypothetical protein
MCPFAVVAAADVDYDALYADLEGEEVFALHLCCPVRKLLSLTLSLHAALWAGQNVWLRL